MLTMTEWWERLRDAVDEAGLSGAELARISGLEYHTVNKYLNGGIQQPRGNAMQKLADAVGRSILWIRDGITTDSESIVPSANRMVVARVIGKVEAGTFREVDSFDQSEPVELAIPPDERFPRARQLVFDVAGDSMNALKPRPILEGDRIICVAYEDVQESVTLRDDMIVVIERTRDDGQIREWSVKQMQFLGSQTIFHPRSANPKHKPIVIDRDARADHGEKIEVIAIVRRVINDLPL